MFLFRMYNFLDIINVQLGGVLSFLVIVSVGIGFRFLKSESKHPLQNRYPNIKIRRPEHRQVSKIASKYVVLTSAAPKKEAQFIYPFYLAITSKIWQNLGYESFIILTGNKTLWKTDSILKYITGILEKDEHITLFFLESDDKTAVLLSQVSRIFAANLVSESDFIVTENSFLITSDADLWPTNSSFLNHDGKQIIATATMGVPGNFKGCCYKYLATSCIGMNHKTWLEVMNYHDVEFSKNLAPMVEDYKNGSRIQNPWNGNKVIPLVKNGGEIMNYLETEFGDLVRSGSEKPSSSQNSSARNSWFIDQKLVSKRVAQWVRRNGHGFVKYGVKPDETNRLNRGKAWSRPITQEITTLHLPYGTYFENNWSRLRLIIQKLAGNKTVEYCDEYRKGFIDLFRLKYHRVEKREISNILPDRLINELLNSDFIKLH